MKANFAMKHICIGITRTLMPEKPPCRKPCCIRRVALKKLGRVDHQDAFLDTFALERARGITIFSKQAEFSLPHTEITLLDTPGTLTFRRRWSAHCRCSTVRCWS